MLMMCAAFGLIVNIHRYAGMVCEHMCIRCEAGREGSEQGVSDCIESS